MVRARLTLALAALAATPTGAALAQNPILSEFQASNAKTLADEDGDSSDWIEIHNPAALPIDLGGWYLTDDPGDPARWQIPSPTPLGVQRFLVVFASGKDRAVAGGELHTDFKLDADGESVLLVRPDGVTIASGFPGYPPQEQDTSYGEPFDPGPTGGESYFIDPTPGEPNGPGGPLVLDVQHAPHVPGPLDDLALGARVPGLVGGAVELLWRIDFDPEQSTPMLDDGLGADRISGDEIYSAALSASVYDAGQMVRYKVHATDAAGHESTLPLFKKPKRSPQYFGTMVADPAVQSPLPIWWWWVENPGLAGTLGGTRASVFYDDEFYENVKVRRRGGSSAFYPKLSFKFDFNKGYRLRYGEGPPADELDLNTTYSDKAFVRQPLAFEVYGLAGCVASESFPLRVQQNGQFFSVAIFVEEPGEESFLERHGLDPQGALYKMYNEATHWTSGVEKKTRLHEDNQDLKELVLGIQLVGDELRRFVFDHVDVPATINYLAATCVMHDNDHVAKNYFLYRDSEGDLEWRFIPWDKDLTWGRNFTNSVLNDTIWANDDPYSHPLFGDKTHPKNDGPWNRLVHAMYAVPETREMYLRRLRTVMDELLRKNNSPSAERYLERRLRAYEASMSADVALDEAKWGIPPWGTPYDFHQDLARLLALYAKKRRTHLYVTHGPGGSGLVPPPHEHPPIELRHLEGDPPSGNQDEEYVLLMNPATRAADITGWRLEGAVDFTFEPGTVIAGEGGTAYASPHPATFRARSQSPTGGEGHLLLGPYAGHISPGETLRLLDRNGVVVDEKTF